MQTILSGIKNTGTPHIGSYLGFYLPLARLYEEKVKGKNDFKLNLFIPDLHALTIPLEADKYKEMYKDTMQNLKFYAACGIDLSDPNVVVYRQSRVPAHSELCVLLNNFTSFGELSRQTQFKDKQFYDAVNDDNSPRQVKEIRQHILDIENFLGESKRTDMLDEFKDLADLALRSKLSETSATTVGLFGYPVLMAADILLYNAKFVPVGEDQRQHVELARDIAGRFNNKFGETFVLPGTLKEQVEFASQEEPVRIMSLSNPLNKMSKSVTDPKGTVDLVDSLEAATKKIMSAETDSLGSISLDRKGQPGIYNLLQILAIFSARSLKEIEAQYTGSEKYGDLKKDVAEVVTKLLSDIQEKFNSISDEDILNALEKGEKIANEVSTPTLLKVQKAVGLRE